MVEYEYAAINSKGSVPGVELKRDERTWGPFDSHGGRTVDQESGQDKIIHESIPRTFREAQ